MFAMRLCAYCHHQNSDQAQFCSKCGRPFRLRNAKAPAKQDLRPGRPRGVAGQRPASTSAGRRCPRCRRAIPSNAGRCPKCGFVLNDRKRKVNSRMIVGIAAVSVLVAAILLFFIPKAGHNQQQPDIAVKPTNTANPAEIGLWKIQGSYALLPEAQAGESACIVIAPNGQRKAVSMDSTKQYMWDVIQSEIEASQNSNTNPVSFSIDYSEDDGWNLLIDMPLNDSNVEQMLKESDQTIYTLIYERMIRGMQGDFDTFLGTRVTVTVNITDTKGDAVARVYSPANGGDTLGDSPDMPGVYRINDSDAWENDTLDSDVWNDDMQEDAQSTTVPQEIGRFSTFEQALQYYGVTLNNVDMKYDMPHLYTQYFSLEGIASLGGTYYGYEGLEAVYFGLIVNPDNRPYDYWVIYCDRNEFAELYEFAKQNQEFRIKAICRMDAYNGDSNASATLHYVWKQR